MALTASVNFNFSASLTGTPTGSLAVGSFRHPLDAAIAFAEGTGAGQANKVWTRKDKSLALSSAETWDLSGGGLTDVMGTVLVFTRMVAIAVYAKPANTNNVVVGGAANSVLFLGGATHTAVIRPGGLFVLVNPTAAGWAVSAGATDEVLVTNSGAGTAVVYDIAILGS